MKTENEQNAHLLQEIKELQREIARLSATLAFKKLETNHPALERLASDVERMNHALHDQTARISNYGKEYFSDLSGRQLVNAVSRILLIGIIGYAISYIFGWFEHEEEQS